MVAPSHLIPPPTYPHPHTPSHPHPHHECILTLFLISSSSPLSSLPPPPPPPPSSSLLYLNPHPYLHRRRHHHSRVYCHALQLSLPIHSPLLFFRGCVGDVGRNGGSYHHGVCRLHPVYYGMVVWFSFWYNIYVKRLWKKAFTLWSTIKMFYISSWYNI